MPINQSSENYEIRLALAQPFQAEWILSFLDKRALPGLEIVNNQSYIRRLDAHDISITAATDHMLLQMPMALSDRQADIEAQASRLFDLQAESSVIDAHLCQDPVLGELVLDAPGIRVPGVWDPFEGAVKAILGQQVSLERSIALAGRLMALFGTAAEPFPSPEILATADVSSVGIPGIRGEAIRQLARLVLDHGSQWLLDAEAVGNLTIKGIGPWTKAYLAMRISKDADAFPASDWAVCKMLGVNAGTAMKMAEAWRPFRAYAVMHLWRAKQNLKS